MRSRRLGCLAAVLAVAVAPVSAEPGGPPLSVPAGVMEAALSCPATFTSAHEPVLLVHGTAITAEESWAWNYAEVLPDQGFDVCMVHLPHRSWEDIQIAAEYVVHAIRLIAERSGSTVDVLGHSQGTLEPRWALRWWPDLQALVDDLVLLASPSHGTSSAAGLCIPGSCPPAAWQMSPGSAFVTALNSADETPGPVSYTSLFSQFDELVQPPSTAEIDGASNVLIQDLCPARPVHHAGAVHDAVYYALVIDAFVNPGPADPQRVGTAPCLEVNMPGVNLLDAVAGNALLYGNGVLSIPGARKVSEEPPLAPYAQ